VLAALLLREPAAWVTALGAALRHDGCALRELDLCSTLRSEVEAACVAEALCYNASLTQLDVSNCHFAGGRVTRALRDALRRPACPLVKLVLSRNALTYDTERIAAGLHGNASLTELSLQGCSVCARGAAALASALAANTTLLVVDLLQNSVGDAGAQALAAALRANDTLRILALLRPLADWELNMLRFMPGAPAAQNGIGGDAEEALRRAAARRGVVIGPPL
jgi:hypothetical protein